MILGHGIFVRKEIKNDPIGKFLTDKKMDTFWKVILDSHLKKDKLFNFSEKFKNVISALFLK